jgi:hypothetical protein
LRIQGEYLVESKARREKRERRRFQLPVVVITPATCDLSAIHIGYIPLTRLIYVTWAEMTYYHGRRILTNSPSSQKGSST